MLYFCSFSAISFVPGCTLFFFHWLFPSAPYRTLLFEAVREKARIYSRHFGQKLGCAVYGEGWALWQGFLTYSLKQKSPTAARDQKGDQKVAGALYFCSFSAISFVPGCTLFFFLTGGCGGGGRSTGQANSSLLPREAKV
jgi:hypothetical protein